MAANELTFNQVATLLNSIQTMVTGQSVSDVTEGNFATVATTVLKAGPEKVYNAISAVLGRTLFSIRPYTRKFKGLERTDGEFKLHTRKIQMCDTEFEDNETTKYPVHYDTNENPASGDGVSLDQQKIKKSKVLQTNFYGMNTYQDHYTIFDEQLEVAFSSPAELGRFFSMISMNVMNKFEQAREDFARMTLVNYIAAMGASTNHIIYLIDEYNNDTGSAYNYNDVMKPENYPSFMRWAFAYIKYVSEMFTERSALYQSNITNYPVIRHTPFDAQRLYILSKDKYAIDANVLATTFNDKYLKATYTEIVNFWQNPNSPADIQFKPTYTDTDGTIKTNGSVIELSHVFAVLCDKDSVGYSIVKSTMKNAPYNAAGDYQNFFLKDYHKNYMDLTEKGVVFLLDTVSGE